MPVFHKSRISLETLSHLTRSRQTLPHRSLRLPEKGETDRASLPPTSPTILFGAARETWRPMPKL